ncbi:MAG: protein translocase subunit SecF [Elusimicrobia bacterium]|nr:protein translocase subunit SecF [Elusimicrobiota bacterium]
MIKIFQDIPHIDWVGRRFLFFSLSGLLIAVSAVSILTKGFNYGIDFTGGTFLQVSFAQPVSLADLRSHLQKAGYPDAAPQSFSGTNSFGIRLKGESQMDAQTIEKLIDSLRAAAPENPITLERKEYVGPAVGAHLRRRAILAIIGSLFAIIVYVAFRFANPIWGIAGVIALAHDVVATAGFFAVTGREIDLVIVAALLTIAGYSINDTIVIFDRMRERMRIHRREPMRDLVNTSINETLSRTLMTNACVMAVVASLFVFGGQVIHDFTTAMLFGSIVGTYSTIAVATPLVFQWEEMKGSRRASSAPPPPPAGTGPNPPGTGASQGKAGKRR